MNLEPPSVAAKNDSNKAKSSDIEIAPTKRHGIPLNLPKANHLLFRSSGNILSEIMPAIENIIESSQETPIKRIKDVELLDTAQSGYPVA